MPCKDNKSLLKIRDLQPDLLFIQGDGSFVTRYQFSALLGPLVLTLSGLEQLQEGLAHGSAGHRALAIKVLQGSHLHRGKEGRECQNVTNAVRLFVSGASGPCGFVGTP